MAAEGVRPRLLRALGWAVRAVVALALLGALASMAGLGSSGALAGLSWPPLLLGLLVTPFAVLIRAFNHTLLANRRVRIMRLRDALGLALVGAGLGLILPAGASDAARARNEGESNSHTPPAMPRRRGGACGPYACASGHRTSCAYRRGPGVPGSCQPRRGSRRHYANTMPVYRA